jgi:uncharacterized membrane protein
MRLLTKNIGRLPIGILIAYFALLLICLAWFMQTYSLLDWEGAVKLGFQNARGTELECAIADVERGVAIADILWVLPLTVLAFIGLIRKKFIGFVASMMVFAICVYFPLFYAFRESMDSASVTAAVVLWAVPSLLGILGLWANRKKFK